MRQELKLHRLTEEEALRRIINWLKGSGTKSLDPVNYPSYGHELYVPNVIFQCLHEVMNDERGKNPGVMRSYAMNPHQPEAAPFYDAVWTLCRIWSSEKVDVSQDTSSQAGLGMCGTTDKE